VRRYRNILLLFQIILLSGCVINLEPNRVKTGGTQFYEERWYINQNIKDSTRLGSSTNDYGAAAEKKKDRYIIKYFSNATGEEIPLKSIYKVKAYKPQYKIGEYIDPSLYQYLYFKDSIGNYTQYKEIFIEPHLSEYTIPVKQCFQDGWCQLYEDWNNKIFYIKESALYK